jgi:hypothetical protein
MLITSINQAEIPPDAAFPLDEDDMAVFFADFLMQSRISIAFEWFDKTSDVLIASEHWDSSHDSWGLRVFAVDSSFTGEVRQSLLDLGLPTLREWFVSTHHELHANIDKWIYRSVTFRYEEGQLLHKAHTGGRDFKRPPNGWLEDLH